MADLLGALGVDLTVGEGELVSDALVLLKVIDAEGGVRLRVINSDGMSWLERLGMLTAAEHLERPSNYVEDEEF